MKIDMTSTAITARLKMVSELRRVCLSLANTGIGKKTRKEYTAKEKVQRTTRAIGHT